jgi:hypothetical protein
MGIFDWIGKKKCASCGVKLLTRKNLVALGKMRVEDPYMCETTTMMVIGRVPAFICTNCGAGVCLVCGANHNVFNKGKIIWENFPQCPRCGQNMEGLFSDEKLKLIRSK